eukprot:15448144-Alexandrium_andersonii.AAC.1
MRDSADVEDDAGQGGGNPSNRGSARGVSTPVCPQGATPNLGTGRAAARDERDRCRQLQRGGPPP